jgi:hypothetical protein
MKNEKLEKQASSEIAQSREFTQEDAASIIKAELGYVNGWAVSERKFAEHCNSAAQRILAAAERDTRERCAQLVENEDIDELGKQPFSLAEIWQALAERIRGKE